MDCRASRGELQASINVTPLVDVVLVLLIILMVVVPLALHGHDLVIPRVSVEAPAVAGDPVVLAIDPANCPATTPPGDGGLPADCHVSLGGEPVPVGELRARVSAIFTDLAPSDRVLLFTADERMNYEAVMRVVDLAQSAAPGLRLALTPAPAWPGGVASLY